MNERSTGVLKQQGAIKPMDALFDALHTDVTVTYFMLPVSSSDKPVEKNVDKPAAASAGEKKHR